MTEDRRKWHIKKELSLGDVMAVVIAIMTVIVAYFTMDKRVAILEAYATTAVRERFEIIDWLKRIETKIDNRRIDH